MAGVIAHEYPGTLPKLVVYSLASLVSYSRIKGKQHFSSDVFVGSVLGNMVAQNVYERHHDPDLGGEAWHLRSVRLCAGTGICRRPVWVRRTCRWIVGYTRRSTAFSAMGLIDSGFAGLRPWTRSECARLVGEAMDQASGYPENSVAFRYFEELATRISNMKFATWMDRPTIPRDWSRLIPG